MAIDSHGYIYVTSYDDYPTGSVNVYKPDGSQFGAITHNITSPLAIAIDANDKIYVANIGYAYAIGSESPLTHTEKSS